MAIVCRQRRWRFAMFGLPTAKGKSGKPAVANDDGTDGSRFECDGTWAHCFCRALPAKANRTRTSLVNLPSSPVEAPETLF